MAELGVAETVVPVVGVVVPTPVVAVSRIKAETSQDNWMSVARIWVWRPLVVTASGSASDSTPVRCSRAWMRHAEIRVGHNARDGGERGPVLRRPLVSI